MKKIVISIGDGTIEIMSAPRNWREEYQQWIADRQKANPGLEKEALLYKEIAPENMTHGEYIELIQEKDIPTGQSSRIVDDSIFPEDKTFREAWTDDLPGEQIDVDMTRAKKIYTDIIRAKRDEKWEDFDKRYVMAQRDGESLTALEAEREILKDIPQNARLDIDAATTPDILKETMPIELL